MKGAWTLKMIWRELVGLRLRLLFFLVTIAIGVASYVALVGLSDAFLKGVEEKVRLFLGGDLVVSAQRRIPEALAGEVTRWPGSRAASRQQTTTSMVTLGDSDPKLVEVRVVDRAFPLLGEVRTDPDGAVREFAAGALVDASLGNSKIIRVGEGSLPVEGVLAHGSDLEIASFFTLPRVYVRPEVAERLGLVSEESRFRDRILLTLVEGADLDRTAAEIRARLAKDGVRARVQTYLQSANRIERQIRNVSAFVLVVGMSCLVLASLAAANGILEYLRQRFLDAAILRCLGVTPKVLVAAFAGTVLAIVAVGALLGVGGAFLLEEALTRIPFVRAAGVSVAWDDLAMRGIQVAGILLVMVVLAIVPRLSALARSAPSEALRDANGVRFSAAWELALLALGTLLLPLLYLAQTGVNRFSVSVSLASACLLVLFGGLAHLVVRFSIRASERGALSLRLALHEVASRRSGSVLVLSVIGFSVFLTLTVLALRTDLLAPLRSEGGRPNVYLVDVQPSQKNAVEEALVRVGATEVASAPLVRGRLVSLAGRAVTPAPEAEPPEEEQEGSRWRDRELNLTYREALSPGERVVEGEFWKAGETAQASLEERMARRLGARVGDRVEIDIQGVVVTATITSLRSVTWQNARPNFFWVLHPELLAEAPQLHLLAAAVPKAEARAELKRRVAEGAANVSVVDATEIVARVEDVHRNLESVVNFLGGALITVALLLLATGVAATRFLREKHLAILRSLGLGRRALLTSVSLEFLFLGFMGSLVGGLASLGVSWVATRVLLEEEPSLHPWPAVAALGLASLLCLVVGLLTLIGPLRRKPLEVLRS